MNIKYNFYFWLCNFKMIIYGHVSVPYTLTLDRKKRQFCIINTLKCLLLKCSLLVIVAEYNIVLQGVYNFIFRLKTSKYFLMTTEKMTV